MTRKKKSQWICFLCVSVPYLFAHTNVLLTQIFSVLLLLLVLTGFGSLKWQRRLVSQSGIKPDSSASSDWWLDVLFQQQEQLVDSLFDAILFHWNEPVDLFTTFNLTAPAVTWMYHYTKAFKQHAQSLIVCSESIWVLTLEMNCHTYGGSSNNNNGRCSWSCRCSWCWSCRCSGGSYSRIWHVEPEGVVLQHIKNSLHCMQ